MKTKTKFDAPTHAQVKSDLKDASALVEHAAVCWNDRDHLATLSVIRQLRRALTLAEQRIRLHGVKEVSL